MPHATKSSSKNRTNMINFSLSPSPKGSWMYASLARSFMKVEGTHRRGADVLP